MKNDFVSKLYKKREKNPLGKILAPNFDVKFEFTKFEFTSKFLYQKQDRFNTFYEKFCDKKSD